MLQDVPPPPGKAGPGEDDAAEPACTRVPADAGPRSQAPRLTGERELASRLSSFLWNSTPDTELLAAAEAGRLRQPEVLRSQVERMLGDRRARALLERLAGQGPELERSVTRLLRHGPCPIERVPDGAEEPGGSLEDVLREVLGSWLTSHRHGEDGGP